MAHHIYQTEGIVIRSFPEGETSKYVEIFTRDLGMVGAHATSIRAEKSKLRYALADYSLSLISLVRGKLAWKIVNAVPGDNFFFEFKNDVLRRKAFVRILRLARKLIHGEEKNVILYETIMGALRALQDVARTPEDIVDIQLLAALRVLNHLGYGVPHQELKQIALENGWETEVLQVVNTLRSESKELIKRSLSETHL